MTTALLIIDIQRALCSGNDAAFGIEQGRQQADQRAIGLDHQHARPHAGRSLTR